MSTKLKLFVNTVLIYQFLTVNCELFCAQDEAKLICASEDEENYLESGIVSGYDTIEEISLIRCQLTRIEAGSFENLPKLKELDVSFNLLMALQDKTFEGLTMMQTLNLSYNMISETHIELLSDAFSLQVLDLTDNQLTDLPDDIFHANERLHWLSLSSNYIKELSSTIFDRNKEITQLDLSNNRLTDLPVDIFNSLKYLRVLKLSSNELSQLDPDTFNENPELTKLSLSDNAINDINDKYSNLFAQLESLDLSKNILTDLKEDVFSSLVNVKYLNFSGNQLKRITNIASLPKLIKLDVANNKLQYMPIFTSSSLKYIDISGNLFTNFGTNIGAYIPRKLNVFLLHGNPWQCACLNQLLGLLQRRKINYADKLYFNGKRPVCAVLSKKPDRCIREPSQDQYFKDTFFNSLKKYKIQKTLIL